MLVEKTLFSYLYFHISNFISLFSANKAKMFYGMPLDTELLHALNDEGDSEDESESTTDKDGKEKPKVGVY